ncbi:RNA-guided endonuclease TnpB family protein [Streptomyces sp. CC219B]|uniref:RNA-guided endonuclease InsQ/TnpB family protein n=1 Tax=Streptomyces sp. CC219B TaxID=3044574 RepID=UPI0024A916E4|nr:RNA-guided endonuclease TnpB family protein [Streptomyces sp. CC219B]
MTYEVKRAFKYRFYPTDEQAAELSRTFGCVRYVYNWALQLRSEAYTLRGEKVGYPATDRALTALKASEEAGFLREVSSVPLQQALRHLQGAFQAFFDKRARYPRFKSKKKARPSATYTRSAFRWRSGQLFLAKMSSPLDIVWSRPMPKDAEPTTVTVSRDAAGRWFVSLLVADTILPLRRTRTAVGVDAGVSSLVTLSSGEKVANPKQERRERTRLAKAQREVARKQKGSSNRAKARVRVAKIHVRIADRRRDFLHKLTTRLVQENQLVVIEDLTVRNLLKNGSLARAISDAAWTQMRSMLEYKCAWYGRELVVVDRWHPSSKACSVCGQLNGSLSLNVREWTCNSCGTRHDRDHNAAQNILAAGLAVAACGAGVRPQRNFVPHEAVGVEAGRALVRTGALPAERGGEKVNRRAPLRRGT